MKPVLSMERVFAGIMNEREYQDQKHGDIEEHGHTVGGWLLIIEAELAEAKRALIKGGSGRDHVMAEILQIAATATAALEQHGIDTHVGRSL